MGGEGISEYEKQRLARISENKARLEALGLPHLTSVIGSFSKQLPKARNLKNSKGKRNGVDGDDEDVEYRPSDDDQKAEDDDREDSSSASEEEESARASSNSRRKGKNRSSLTAPKVKKRSIAKEILNESSIFDDDAILMQAIALSLEATKGDLAGISQNSTSKIANEKARGKKYNGKTKEFVARRKTTTKLNNFRVQLTEDEVVAFFFLFDETGKGYITQRDVKKMACSHDFSWTDLEVGQMIRSFDNDGDGKLSLEDFWSIVTRCRMMQDTQES